MDRYRVVESVEGNVIRIKIEEWNENYNVYLGLMFGFGTFSVYPLNCVEKFLGVTLESKIKDARRQAANWCNELMKQERKNIAEHEGVVRKLSETEGV